jgi:hypothetical protein
MHTRKSPRAAALALILAAILAAAGCAAAQSTPNPSVTPAPAASSPSSAGAGVTINFEEGSQVELIEASDRRILIDVYDPSKLTAPATAADILLVTNAPNESFNQTFVDEFPGLKLYTESGDVTIGGLKVTSIVAAEHDSNVAVGTNRIYVFEIGGLRIAHLGWTGQAALTDEQLARLGKVDVAFSVLFDLTGSDPTDSQPLKLIEQLKPRLFIPTEVQLATLNAVNGRWPGQYLSRSSLRLTPTMLPATTTMLFMGKMAKGYGSMLKLPECGW